VSEPPSRTRPLGAVLAGGAATRFGGAKATLELGGRPLISYPLDALTQAGLAAIVVAKADSPLPPLETDAIAEPDEPLHPLAGVVAALRHAGSPGALIVPCDAPFLSAMLLRVLASAEKATAVRSSGRIHPLIAFYPHSALSPLEGAVHGGASATQALEGLEPDLIEAPERETFNVNTPEDLARAEDLLRQPRS
jgi:molybdopterin-guanine dinucleotide biosynthesis protein A